jgi:hypothetical protein
MRLFVAIALMFGFTASLPARQDTRLSDADLKEISGRWIGTVTADIGTMPIALNLKLKDKAADEHGRTQAELSGALETAHGNWEITSVRKNSAGGWVIGAKMPDGLAGTLSGRVKDGRLAGDWNFKPRAVGTFELDRPANEKKQSSGNPQNLSRLDLVRVLQLIAIRLEDLHVGVCVAQVVAGDGAQRISRLHRVSSSRGGRAGARGRT